MNRYVLLGKCNDDLGLVYLISQWIQKINGNILDLEQYVYQEEERFFIRVEWSLVSPCDIEILIKNFEQSLGKKLKMDFFIVNLDKCMKMAIFVSQFDHCLWDLFVRYHKSDSKVKIEVIISNHYVCKSIAKMFDCKFIFVDFKKKDKEAIEIQQLRILDKYKIDFVVLARYMQILSDKFIKKWVNKIINIHHSFLPAFPGAKPYHQAYERGVKVIGASAHFVTEELDAGPIIEQEVVRITHRDDVEKILHKGRELEKIVLSRAVDLYINHCIFVEKNRTYILV